MLPRRRQRLVVVWLSALALLAQLVLPMAHASVWAQRNGDPLLYGFCGALSPNLLRRLRESAPPELLKQLGGDDAKLGKLACDFCGMAHAAHLAGAGRLPGLDSPPPPSDWRWRPRAQVAGWRVTDQTRARGPPQHSRV